MSWKPGTASGALRPDRQTELVAELLRTGVSIGVCRLDDVFTEEDFGSHKWTTLAVFIQLAFQESKQKAERVAASWEQRRKMARQDGRLMGNRLPAWLEKADGAARIIPERAAAVRRIFALAADGLGHSRIVGTLEREGVKPFGAAKINGGRSRSQFSGRWTKPYVANILNDRRAVGEMQPLKDGKPDGAAMVRHYPVVVTEDEFLLARAGQVRRKGRDRTGRQKAFRQSKYTNVFRGLLVHARDGEGFTLHNKGTMRRPELLLINAKGIEGRDRCYTFPYPIFETAVLKMLREVDPAEIIPRDHPTLSRADTLRRTGERAPDIGRLQEDLKAEYSKAIVAVLRSREVEEERVAQLLQEELARTVKPTKRAGANCPTWPTPSIPLMTPTPHGFDCGPCSAG